MQGGGGAARAEEDPAEAGVLWARPHNIKYGISEGSSRAGVLWVAAKAGVGDQS